MKIAVLAWGSLVWDRRNLATVAEFRSNGPRLPLEFSRISGDGRLTLVIDETFGVPCATYSAVSACDDLKTAIENLREREKMLSTKGAGFIDLSSHKRSIRAAERHPRAVETIEAWTEANHFDATIWTALANNFHEPNKANTVFSVEAAIRYLETRDAPTLSAALNYVWKSPPEVQTPVREAVNARWPQA